MQSETIHLLGTAEWSLLTVICICLFVGAMGKSAQFPLHVWLPDSMEGPTPISALIHAATMVTAGIFMVARMSPLFEMSETALSFVLVIGAITAFFMGLLGIVQNDIKRVVAYSTLSQLGYMTVALGASAYSVAVFHLMTHAFFKALLFLAAGSVIIGMHHNQDIRQMGGLRRYMPITWITSLLGSLALVGTPFFSGFYSKESIIEAVRHADIPGSGIAYAAVLSGVFITAFYSFRMYFLVFHGSERFHHGHAECQPHQTQVEPDVQDHHDDPAQIHVPHESPAVVTLPLIFLAVPSVLVGLVTIGPMLFGDFFKDAIAIDPGHPAMAELASEWHGWLVMGLHGFMTLPFWLMLAGIACAWYFYLVNPAVPARIRGTFSGIYALLDNKYYFDAFNEKVFAGGARMIGNGLWKRGDQSVIDGLINGSARLVGGIARISRTLQTGFLNHYAIAMIVGLAACLVWFIPLLTRR
jgi:NADH-quinone oxidoreductase subunit L